MQVIAWILGEYGSAHSDRTKIQAILNLLSQFSYGTFESERTRACILLALTRLHSALEFETNDYVQQIMDDYATSRNLEVQQRANDYHLLRSHHRQLTSNGKDLIFKVPLTDKQVEAEGFDLDLNFLDNFVQQQLAEGKPAYDQAKSNLFNAGEVEA